MHYKDEYLFLHRSPNKRVDPNKLNGIGGRVEPGENYLDAAIREAKEESGYDVTPKDISLAGVVKLEGGYGEDWIMCFFKIEVHSKDIPNGIKTDDGDLVWLHKDKALDSEYELVDDINYCFKDIVKGTHTFFMTASVNEKTLVDGVSINRLSK